RSRIVARSSTTRILATIGAFPAWDRSRNSITNSTLILTHSDSWVTSGEAAMAKSAAGAGRAGGPIGVFLLDDHEVVRRGLRDILMAEPDIEVVGEADQVATALPLILELRPNVAVLDVRLPDGDGISLCREIRSARPETACLMLTSFGDDQAMVSSIIAGASGYVMKTSGSAELIGAIRASASGLSMIDPRAALEVIERLRNQTVTMTSMSALTDQERRVLDLVGE